MGSGFYVIKTFKKHRLFILMDMGLLLLLFLRRELIYGLYIAIESWSIWRTLRFQKLSSGKTYLRTIAIIMIGMSNASENPAVQIKFNPRAYRHLKIELTQVLTLEQAEDLVFGP